MKTAAGGREAGAKSTDTSPAKWYYAKEMQAALNTYMHAGSNSKNCAIANLITDPQILSLQSVL